tara:strand:- start:97 stop:564 length:468 start_codon:yes stop_codon:yes gene_type:complete
MKKSINIKHNDKGDQNSKKKGKKRSFIYDKNEIENSLGDFYEVTDYNDVFSFIPHHTYIKYINKEDGGLREGGFFVKTSNTALSLCINGFTWKVSFAKHKIFANKSHMENYEDEEKCMFVDFLERYLQSNKLQILIKGKQVNWKQLLEYYESETL